MLHNSKVLYELASYRMQTEMLKQDTAIYQTLLVMNMLILKG